MKTLIEEIKNPLYIGVTGFINNHQVISLQKMLSLLNLNGRKIMIGVLANDGSMTKSWSSDRCPKIDFLDTIFVEDKRFLNIVHYNTRTPESLSSELESVANHCNRNLHGFKLNVTWPDPREIEKHKNKFPDHKIILQVGVNAFKETKNSNKELAIKLKDYKDLINYVLLDKSEGRGKSFAVASMINSLNELIWHGYNVVVAGGLGPLGEHLVPLKQLADNNFKYISTDAEGNLMNTEPENKTLSISKSFEYIRKVNETLK